jgi:hypothetical protein
VFTVDIDGWRIQLRYQQMTPAQWQEVSQHLNNVGDLFHYNMGVDKRGRYVAFDW